jgi:hypothetical protein
VNGRKSKALRREARKTIDGALGNVTKWGHVVDSWAASEGMRLTLRPKRAGILRRRKTLSTHGVMLVEVRAVEK